MSDKLVIRAINEMDDESWEPLYWSKELGWTVIEEADTFTEEEAMEYLKPVSIIGGEWVYQSVELGVDVPSSEGVEDE